jgi:hypothetical protein
MVAQPASLFTSPRLREEVGSPKAVGVRGSLRALLCLLCSLIDAPHPSPLPVRTGRGGAARKRRT